MAELTLIKKILADNFGDDFLESIKPVTITDGPDEDEQSVVEVIEWLFATEEVADDER